MTNENEVQQAPAEEFKPNTSIIRGYAADIEIHGRPVDSGLPAYFRKVADYYENKPE